jgi:PAS domain S-box-containing protein
MVDPVSTRPRRLEGVALLILLAHVLEAATLAGSHEGSAVSNLLQLGAGLTAATAAAGASRRARGFARRFWALITTAFLLWSLGQLAYAWNENWLGVAVAQPSWTHFLFRIYGAPLLMALLIVNEDKEGGPNWVQALDFAQVGILFLFFYFDLYFVPGGEWQGISGLNLWGFFSLSDVENWSLAAAFLARFLLSRRSEERELSGRLVPYLLCYAFCSSFSNYYYIAHAPRTGEWPDLVFTFSLTLGSLLIGSWRASAETARAEAAPGPAVTWAPAALPLLTLALAMPVARREPWAAFVAIFGSMACFAARLLIILYRRQQVMEALRSSEARYANLVRLAPDAIFVHEGGRITFANEATARNLGMDSADELVGRSALDFTPAEFRADVARTLQSLTTESAAHRLVALRRDGVRIPWEAVGMSFDPLPGATGPPARLVIARDVTERVQAEARREALIRELEAKNAELERFTYTVSHDLRSPLITISGFLRHVETAAEKGDLEALRSDLDRIRRAATKMDLLLQDLLELSRVGHVLAATRPVSLQEVCEEALALVAGRLAARGVAVTIEPSLPEVVGDRARLVEIFQNLLDNAAKFMGETRDPRIEIGARREAADEVFFVRDNGIGIDPAHQARVFGLFDKLDPQAEGTGIGLALVKRIVELHGGRIWVESDGAGRGTSVCFTLPGIKDTARNPS